MRGNSAILKCLIPSFVADFVSVTAWVDSDGDEYLSGSDFDRGRLRKNIKFDKNDSKDEAGFFVIENYNLKNQKVLKSLKKILKI